MRDSNSDTVRNLRGLFDQELKDIYWVEKELTSVIPRVIEKVTSEDLKDALTHHLRETENQVRRLEDVFDALGERAEAKTCHAMEGILKEADEIMEETEQGLVRDAGIIAAQQKVEHYEIATYGTLCSYAKIMGEERIESLLNETLQEEKNADKTLTEVAVSKINIEIT